MISIIVPVYNVTHYLSRCLDSILAQTYENFEIIVIDDGSTDGSANICDEYAKKDFRIKVFHQSNRGLSAARNIGLSYASGEYIGFVDADDHISCDMYKILYTVLTDYDVDLVCCDRYIVVDNKVYTKKRSTGEVELLTAKEYILKLLINNATTTVWDKLYKREVLSESPFFEGVFYEDARAMPDILSRCRNVALIHSPHYYYTSIREGSICNSFSAKHIKDLFDACDFRNKRIKEYYPELAKFADVLKMRNQITIYIRIVNQMKYNAELSVLGASIRRDIKLYPAEYMLHVPILRLPSALILRYFPMGFNIYVSLEHSVRWILNKINIIFRYKEISQQ